jgi:hypothetical protein
VGRSQAGVQLARYKLTDAYTEASRLTARDQWLIELLAEHRVLTADLVAAGAFDSLPRARRRLRLLVERAVLARFRHYIPVGTQPWRYTLGVLGEAVHAAHTGAPMPRPAKVTEKIARLAASRSLPHTLGVNRFFTGLIAHARGEPGGCALAEWWSERRVGETTGRFVRPDGYGLWTEPQPGGSVREAGFFLEYDRGSEQHTELIGKLGRYAELAVAGITRPIVFVFTHPAREINFIRHAIAAGWPRQLTIATTSTNYYTPISPARTSPHDGPAGPIWLLLRDSQRRRLIELAQQPPYLDHHTNPRVDHYDGWNR